MELPTTTDRVAQHTAPYVNQKLQQELDSRLRYYAAHREQIRERLRELDREWDIERALEANAASVALLGLTLGITADRKWLLLPVAVAGFLLQHALQGWCPPVPLFRRLGFRTQHEIEEERNALKVLRGDYDGITAESGPEQALRAVQH